MTHTLSAETLGELTGRHREPAWRAEQRKVALDLFEKLPLPDSRYTKIRNLDLRSYRLAWECPDKPPEFVGEREAVYSQLDNAVVSVKVPEHLSAKGVIFCDLETALREHADLLQRYLFQAVTPGEDKLTALVAAFATSGLFVYIPQDVTVEEPLRVVHLLDRSDIAALSHLIVVAERGSRATLLEECYARHPHGDGAPLHAAVAEIYVGEGAHLQFGAMQNWNEETYSFVRRRAHVQRDARMHWTIGWLGGKLTRSYVESRLMGPGAEMEDIQVLFGRQKQHFDLTSSLRNMAPHVKGEIHMKGVLKDRARAVMYGFIKVEPPAQQSNSYQLAQGLLLNDGAHCDAIPGLEIEANDVRATHGASIGPIDEEQIFYLQSRGLEREQAKRTIVEGFLTPTLEQIPIAGVRERFHALVEEKWH
ncbi:MAG: Fe-S cluster assembly protein SufD [Candidatus Bipolaricaulota bacterium]|nr:Fe-S cluster assembly protein SufD [Candidatus Bipolaricaulota bacterium]MDW8110437.1 Fe-S cluster assembly protein SufD [Candidatus Bipolaricaulota bacterium]